MIFFEKYFEASFEKKSSADDQLNVSIAFLEM
jgi:hypothetical protein